MSFSSAPPERASHLRDKPVQVVRRGWMVEPWFDLLFVANVLWPLVGLVGLWGDGFEGREGLRFWQVYFVTTPHRWITIGLVFLDRDHLRQRPALFVGLALAVVASCLAIRLSTGALTCLLTIDYLWNAWHFAAQHHGIYRVYSRLGQSGLSAGAGLEKVLLRTFLLYVAARVAGGVWPDERIEHGLAWLDWLILLTPLAVLLRDGILGTGPFISARRIYLCSVCALYVSMLWAVHTSHFRLMLALTTASALFHAIEYLALASWSVRQREQTHGARLGWLQWFVTRWGFTLAGFAIVLGFGGWVLERQWLDLWLLLNVMAAFLHYAYDGIIWRRPRRPASRGAST